MRRMQPKVIRADDSHQLALYDVAFRYGLTASETDGRLSVLEVTIPPKTLVKPHAHSREDEFSVVLSGRIGVQIGEETVEDVPAGSWLAKPRAVRHALWNVTDDPARILEIVLPGGIEGYFEQLAPILTQRGPEWTERYAKLAEEYGLEIFDDWSRELQERYGITL